MIRFESIGYWTEAEGVESDVVISSRVRVARNLANFVFPHRASEAQLMEVCGFISKAIRKNDELKDLNLIFLEELFPQERDMLAEKHLISPVFNEGEKGRAVILSEKRSSLCVMVNEEDHLRIQVFSLGFQLQNAWKIVNEVDDTLSSHLPYAFSKRWGYLTECPTNIGTAMKASIMMHLPALTINDEIELLFSNLSDSGITIRGLFGEGTDIVGNFYQISNQVTLGKSESEIIGNLEIVSKSIIEKERSARQLLLKEEKIKLLDEISRSWGILTHAKLISFEEAIDYLSMLRLGIDLKVLSQLSRKKITKLMMSIRSAHLRDLVGEGFNEGSEAEAKVRAELIKRELFKLREGGGINV